MESARIRVVRRWCPPTLCTGVLLCTLLLSACTASTAGNASSGGTLRWRFQTPGSMVAAPAIANGVVYIGSSDGAFSALDARTGTVHWQVWPDGQVSGSPAIADGVVYINSTIDPPDSRLSALDASTGAVRWQSQISSSQDAALMVANGVVYVGGHDGSLVALDSRTGALRWRSQSGSASYFAFSTPVVANGVVYADSEGDQSVYALDANSGAVRWRFTTPFPMSGEFPAAPAVEQGVVYAVFVHSGSFERPTSSIYALDAATGALRWSVHDSMNAYSAPAVADGVIYLSSVGRAVMALDASTGAVRWRLATDVAGGAVPAVANGVLYVGCSDGVVDVLDAVTGAQRWRFQTDSAAPGRWLAPVVANGTAYVSSGTSLYALNA